MVINVSSMNLSFVDQGVSNSPSWIRGGAAGAAGALFIFIELTLITCEKIARWMIKLEVTGASARS